MNDQIETSLASLRAEAPPVTRRAVELGTGLVPGFATYEAPVGEVAVFFTAAGVREVRLVDDLTSEAVEARPPRAWGDAIRRALDEGRPGRLPLDLEGVTPFRRAVLEQTATIP